MLSLLCIPVTGMVKDHSDDSASKVAVGAFHYVKNSGRYFWLEVKLTETGFNLHFWYQWAYG